MSYRFSHRTTAGREVRGFCIYFTGSLIAGVRDRITPELPAIANRANYAGTFISQFPPIGKRDGSTVSFGFEVGGLLLARCNQSYADFVLRIPFRSSETRDGYETMVARCASLSVVLLLAERVLYEQPALSRPLIQVGTTATEGNYYIHGLFGPQIMKWAQRLGHTSELPSVEAAMAQTWQWLHPHSEARRIGHADIGEDAYPSMRVATDCSLHHAYLDDLDDEVPDFHTNNCESPGEQLTLLSGLAAMTDLAQSEDAFS